MSQLQFLIEAISASRSQNIFYSRQSRLHAEHRNDELPGTDKGQSCFSLPVCSLTLTLLPVPVSSVLVDGRDHDFALKMSLRPADSRLSLHANIYTNPSLFWFSKCFLEC